MLIIRISPNKPGPAETRNAVAVLKRGGLVVYPTETAYALGCDAANAAAVKKIFAVKKRDPSKPLPLIAASKTHAGKYGRSSTFARALADYFWPGPLTLVLPLWHSGVRPPGVRPLARGVTSRAGEIAIRVSPHPVARALAKALGRPLVSTSANRSGSRTVYRIADVLSGLGTLPDLVLDAGTLPRRRPSTIVRCFDGGCEMLRYGALSSEAIRRALASCWPL